MNTRRLNRREFLRLSALTAAGMTAAACAKATPEVIKETVEVEKVVEKVVTATPAASPHQAPALQAKVKAGELPPLAERLPMESLVIKPVEEVGEYGGSWRRCATGPNDRQMGSRLTYESLVRWAGPMDVSGHVPNVVKSWEVSSDATVFTFHMRKGMKWSDGLPFTADDWVFYYEDQLNNEELTPVYPKDLTAPATGEPVVLDKIDEHTFRMSLKIVLLAC